MLLLEIALGLCVLFLLYAWTTQTAAARSGDTRRRHGLHLVTLGLGMSACAYGLHLLDVPRGGAYSLLSLACRLAGITFLWLAWRDHWAQQRERRAALRQERDEAWAFRLALPPMYQKVYSCLNSRAREAVCAAQEEALKQRCCVDTDHLLLGLLQVPHCAASRILERAQISPARLAREIRQAGTAPAAGTDEDAPAAFTPRARQALALAEMEAHRFSKTFVGTEHLLLGLMLAGTGPAASALFASGMTVDAVRHEVIAAGQTSMILFSRLTLPGRFRRRAECRCRVRDGLSR